MSVQPSHVGSGFDSTGHGLSFHAVLPINWRLLAPAGGYGNGAEQRNLDVVAKLMAIENGAADGGPVDQECSADIRRLHLKMDFLIGLVSDLIAGSAPQPVARRVMVCPDSLEWYDPAPPETGAEIEIALHLSPKYPLPLRLRATVECVVKSGEEWMVAATWAAMPADLAEAFERLIFLHHRREVARTASTAYDA